MSSDDTARTTALERAWRRLTGSTAENAEATERVRLWMAGLRREPSAAWLSWAAEVDAEALADRMWLGMLGLEPKDTATSAVLRATELSGKQGRLEPAPVASGLRLDHRTLAALNAACALEGEILG